MNVEKRYKGWTGHTARKRCPHSALRGIYGDEINWLEGYRLECLDCGMYLDGPVTLVENRMVEVESRRARER